jgi:hypothetical protein
MLNGASFFRTVKKGNLQFLKLHCMILIRELRKRT